MATSKGGYVSGGFDILKAPNAPTITSVTTGIGSATVAFTAPADVGGGAITSYTITAVNESTGASTGATGSASPITVLPGSGTFKIRAAATNIYGPGRVSQYSTGNVIEYAGAELYGAGSNSEGQLGDGTVDSKSSPVQVGSLTNWSQVSAGALFSAAVKNDGTLWAWGSNDYGKLGQGNTIFRSSPVQIGALTNWAQVSAGAGDGAHSVKNDGTLWGWGDNRTGQIGDGTIISRSSPVQIGALTDWAQVSSGNGVTVAITKSGSIWSWGTNTNGKLGLSIASTQRRSSPVQVGALTNWFQVDASSNHVSAVKTDGTLWAWGSGDAGRLGDGTVINRSSPVQVGALTNWSQVSAGGSHTVSVKTDGTLWTWGKNNAGELGIGTTVYRSSPVQVGALTDWAQVAAGYSHTASVKTNGTLWTWGSNGSGRLGDGTVVNRSSPVQIGALANWFQVSAGFNHTAALYGVV